MIRLSPSSLNLFNDCPRCFFMEKVNGIKRPRGIFPSLPGGMDTIIKNYFDGHRAKGTLPPEIDGKISGTLFADQYKIQRWRNWRTSDLKYTDPHGHVLNGAIDDLIINDSTFEPFDYKTRASAPKGDCRQYYGTQMDTYGLMLEASGYPTNGTGWLLYFFPVKIDDIGLFKFETELVKIPLDLDNAKNTLARAIETMGMTTPPAPKIDCPYCVFYDELKSYTINE